MKPHEESTKRESRIRAGDKIRNLPTDVHTKLIKVTGAYRYPTQWDCATQALDIGLSVMLIQLDKLGEIVNGSEQTGTGAR